MSVDAETIICSCYTSSNETVFKGFKLYIKELAIFYPAILCSWKKSITNKIKSLLSFLKKKNICHRYGKYIQKTEAFYAVPSNTSIRISPELYLEEPSRPHITRIVHVHICILERIKVRVSTVASRGESS